MRKKGVVIKIDFEKAFDRVEKSSLDFVLKRKKVLVRSGGFGLGVAFLERSLIQQGV